MFLVNSDDAAAIRTVYQDKGEFSAAVELRRLFPGLTMENAARSARTIAGWQPIDEAAIPDRMKKPRQSVKPDAE